MHAPALGWMGEDRQSRQPSLEISERDRLRGSPQPDEVTIPLQLPRYLIKVP